MANYFLTDFKRPAGSLLANLEQGSGLEWKNINRVASGGTGKVKRLLKAVTVPFAVLFAPGKVGKVVAWQQQYGILVSFVNRIIPVRRKMEITVCTFIYKRRGGIRGALSRFVVGSAVNSKRVKNIIVYSRDEAELYGRIFPKARDKFVFTPVGVSFAAPSGRVPLDGGYIFSAGFSNRDYEFLVNAVEGTGRRLVIACRGMEQPQVRNVTVLQDCFGQDTVDFMAGASAVVVPLKSKEISSGQLVFLQAMALGVPVVVTDTPSVREYITDGEDGFLIGNDPGQLNEVLDRIDNDGELRRRVSERGRRKAAGYSIEGLMARVGKICVGGAGS